MFDLPIIGLTMRLGPVFFDLGPRLPLGFRRLSRSLGYIGLWIACISWDLRPWLNADWKARRQR
jgi:hypothetical protein